MNMTDEQDIYNQMARRIKAVRVGDEIKIRKAQETLKFVVVAVYPFHVRAMCNRMNAYGNLITETKCFNLGQLVNLGVEKSGGERFNVPASYGCGSDYQEV